MGESRALDAPPADARTLTIGDVGRLLGAEVVWCPDPSVRVSGVAAADLMSDVLTASRPGMLLITGLASVQAIRTAAIADLAGIVFVRGKRVSDEVVALAREKNIPILATARTMFQAAGLLHDAGATP